MTSFVLFEAKLRGAVSAMENGYCSFNQAAAVSPYGGLGAV